MKDTYFKERFDSEPNSFNAFLLAIAESDDQTDEEKAFLSVMKKRLATNEPYQTDNINSEEDALTATSFKGFLNKMTALCKDDDRHRPRASFTVTESNHKQVNHYLNETCKETLYKQQCTFSELEEQAFNYQQSELGDEIQAFVKIHELDLTHDVKNALIEESKIAAIAGGAILYKSVKGQFDKFDKRLMDIEQYIKQWSNHRDMELAKVSKDISRIMGSIEQIKDTYTNV